MTRRSNVNTATSSTLLAAPTTASRKTAATRLGQAATRMIGSPQKTSETPNGTASRLPLSESAPKAPTKPPTPTAAVR